jgi:hypothetical protein
VNVITLSHTYLARGLPRETRGHVHAPRTRAVSTRIIAAWALVAFFSSPSRAQSLTKPELPDPKGTVVVVDDAGDVGFRISDAQTLHELVISRLRKRLGTDAVVYDGARKSAVELKKLLGPQAETTIQDAQLAWHDLAAQAAPWRVRVRFGQTKKEHWITLSCRRMVDDPKKVVDERRFAGKTFLAARDEADRGIDSFCTALPTMATSSTTTTPTSALPHEPRPGAAAQGTTPAAPPGVRKKAAPVAAPWTPPPRRD